MLSFFGESCLKAAVVERVKEHQRLDQFIQGVYWDGERGCAIGCVLHSGEHMAYETQLGLPVFLAYMDEYIFEHLPIADAKLWPLRFIDAVPVGVDLELVFPLFMHWLLSDPDGIRKQADRRTLPIIDSIDIMYARRIEGIPFDLKAAWAAARAAEAAGATWSGAGAAGAAARTAGAATWAGARAAGAAGTSEAAARAGGTSEAAAWAAWAATWAATWAARAATWAAGVATWAAGAAARTARAGGTSEAAGAGAWAAWAAARAAEAAHIHCQADYLIALLQSYESVPNLDSIPCEEREWIPVRRA